MESEAEMAAAANETFKKVWETSGKGNLLWKISLWAFRIQ